MRKNREKGDIRMKKKLFLGLMLATLLCVTACGNKDTQTDGKNTENMVESQVETQNESQDGTTEQGSQLNEDSQSVEDSSIENTESQKEMSEEEIKASIEGMIGPMDSIILASDGETSYDNLTPDAVWKYLYYVVVNHGYGHQLAEIEGGELKLRSMAVSEYAAAMFGNPDLPEIPSSMEWNVRYDADWDAYYFMLSDRGLDASEVTDYSKNEDGSYDVFVRFYDVEMNETISTWKFRLVENQYADGITNPLFYWTITMAGEIK